MRAGKPAHRKRSTAPPGSPVRTPFPRYSRISEGLADEPHDGEADPLAGRELEIPHTESYGELWRRATVRGRGRE